MEIDEDYKLSKAKGHYQCQPLVKRIEQLEADYEKLLEITEVLYVYGKGASEHKEAREKYKAIRKELSADENQALRRV